MYFRDPQTGDIIPMIEGKEIIDEDTVVVIPIHQWQSLVANWAVRDIDHNDGTVTLNRTLAKQINNVIFSAEVK